MKIYSVERTDLIGRREFINAVVRAENPVQALILVGGKPGVNFDFSNVIAKEILADGDAEIICESAAGA